MVKFHNLEWFFDQSDPFEVKSHSQVAIQQSRGAIHESCHLQHIELTSLALDD